MGSVYHAELRAPGGFSRTCAVKVMKQAASDKHQFMTRMRDEARLLGILQDESLLGVSELVQVEGRDAVIMEFVEGVDLADIVGGAGCTPPRALAELGAEIAATLHRAHVATHPGTGAPLHVIHRDVKPANVMVTPRGNVKLLDFGVARAAFDARESETQGLVLGTLNYFAPEILAGKDPTPAVDVYGLGITLWECAVAREWGSPRVQERRFEERLDARLGELPPEYAALVPVLRGMLSWRAEDRPTGREVEQQLLQAAEVATGQGLRTWSREVVPRLLAEADRTRARKSDQLVGRTLTVEGSGTDDTSNNDDSVSLEDATVLYNRAALPPPPPPAASLPSPPSRAVAPLPPRASAPDGQGRARAGARRGPSILMMAGVGAFAGGLVGLVGVLLIAMVIVFS